MYLKTIHIIFFSIFLTIGTTASFSQEITIKDTLQVNTNELLTIKDSTKVDSTKKKKAILEGIVHRKAKGYEKINQRKKEMTLYDEAELYYQDIELKAGIIVLNYEKNEVYAGRLKDSIGNYTQYPSFKQGENLIEPDSIRFNTKTKKALIWNSRSKQGELNFKSNVSKRENDSVIFMKDVRFTTAKDVDNPEYYFLARKIKFVPGKKVVTGLTNLVIADVPTPIGVPFAYFPMSEESISGFILPTPGQSNTQGYFLQNGGYYFALSKFYDLAVLGDYYTNGSYGLRAESSYALRYKFSGRINLRYENQIQSERGFPDYVKSKQYNIQWSHSQDQKAAANSRFSASVNVSSSQYFRNSLNLSNIGATLNNNLSSSVSYSKTIPTLPQVNLSVTATHSQNTNTEQINMTLPTFQGSVDRIYPFAPKNGTKKGVFQNINLQYNLNAKNEIVTSDSLFFKPQMFKDGKAGFQHSIPLSTNFKVFKYFSVSASSSFNETWVFNTVRKSYSSSENQVVSSRVDEFGAFRTYNFNSSLGTTVYGTFDFGEDKKIQAIRHVMRPSVSYNYNPSFEQFYDTYAIDATGTTMAEYTRFEGGIYGAPGLNKSSSIGFGMGNSFEAKVKKIDKETGKEEVKKVMLLSNLNLSSAYNITADSLALQPLSISGGTTLLKDKMNINFGTNLDPYAIDNTGRRVNTFNIDNGGSLFRMTSANMQINYSLTSSGSDGSKKTKSQNELNGGRPDDLFGKAADLSDNRQSLFDKDKDDKEENKTAEFYNNKIPWDLQFAYSITYNNSNRQSEISNNSLMISGNVELAPRWKVGVSTGYDFAQNGVTFTQFRFERDLESWRMSFNWVPYGPSAYWGFFIGISSSILSDIKWDKNRVPDRILR
ncbi:MAG: lipopolysaccharide assembly outer membrane protein LptD (OstA) [Flavobacterium sp.]